MDKPSNYIQAAKVKGDNTTPPAQVTLKLSKKNIPLGPIWDGLKLQWERIRGNCLQYENILETDDERVGAMDVWIWCLLGAWMVYTLYPH